MEVALSPEKTQAKLTDLRLMLLDGLHDPSWIATFVNDAWSKLLTELALHILFLSMSTPTEPVYTLTPI